MESPLAHGTVRPERHRTPARVNLSAIAFLSVTLPQLAGAPPAAAASVPRVAAPVTRACSLQTGEFAFRHRGEARIVRYFIPPGATSAMPAVVSLHGAGGGNAARQEQGTQFSALGSRHGFIAVYPQSSSETHSDVWNVKPGSPDTDFVGAVVADLHVRGCSSPKNTYVNGFSMGAMLTSRLMCERGQLFAGATMVAGVLPPTPRCRVAPDKPILVLHGYRDTVVNWYGGLAPAVEAATGRWAIFPYNRRAMAEQWAAAKGCTESVRRTQVGMTITIDYRCRGGASTTVLAFLTGGHTWTFPDQQIVTSQLINWMMNMRPTITKPKK